MDATDVGWTGSGEGEEGKGGQLGLAHLRRLACVLAHGLGGKVAVVAVRALRHRHGVVAVPAAAALGAEVIRAHKRECVSLLWDDVQPYHSEGWGVGGEGGTNKCCRLRTTKPPQCRPLSPVSL